MVSDYHKPENVVQPGFQCGPSADPITLTKPVKLCKFFRFNGKCVAGKKCQFKHVQTGDGMQFLLYVSGVFNAELKNR